MITFKDHTIYCYGVPLDWINGDYFRILSAYLDIETGNVSFQYQPTLGGGIERGFTDLEGAKEQKLIFYHDNV